MKRTCLAYIGLLLLVWAGQPGLAGAREQKNASKGPAVVQSPVDQGPADKGPADKSPADKSPGPVLPNGMQPGSADRGIGLVVLEYRNDVKALAGLPGQLGRTLAQNTSLQVVELSEARRRLGPQMDADVARCAGETVCLAQLGKRLGVEQVLLLAVSQLGDVVLALQRISVADARVVSRYADSLQPSQAGLGDTIDEARILGWLQQLFPPETFKRYGNIQVAANIDGAQIYVNSKASGTTPLVAPLQVLAPGNYRILLEKNKFLPFQAAVTVMPDTTVAVTATLLKEQKVTPWYRRWYLWTGIVFGAAAVSATAVAVKLGTDTPAPDTSRIPGSIEFR